MLPSVKLGAYGRVHVLTSSANDLLEEEIFKLKLAVDWLCSGVLSPWHASKISR
jgi:hypothetical protein